MKVFQALTSIVAKPKKRVGRGYGSGVGGHTSTRGTKGQKSRGSGKVPLWFEGGQLPLVKRLPMTRGKGQLQSLKRVVVLKTSYLNSYPETEISMNGLRDAKKIPQRATGVKIVYDVPVEKAISVSGIQISKTAKAAIEKAGGKIIE